MQCGKEVLSWTYWYYHHRYLKVFKGFFCDTGEGKRASLSMGGHHHYVYLVLFGEIEDKQPRKRFPTSDCDKNCSFLPL
jgi:hypothetical protein